MAATVTVGHPFKVGDIFVNSWGYDQTNVDFYEVVAATAKSVKVAQICSEVVEGSEGFMSCRVAPFTGDNRFVNGYGRTHEATPENVVTKYPRIAKWRATDEWYVSFQHGGCQVYNQGATYYASWYA